MKEEIADLREEMQNNFSKLHETLEQLAESQKDE